MDKKNKIRIKTAIKLILYLSYFLVIRLISNTRISLLFAHNMIINYGNIRYNTYLLYNNRYKYTKPFSTRPNIINKYIKLKYGRQFENKHQHEHYSDTITNSHFLR